MRQAIKEDGFLKILAMDVGDRRIGMAVSDAFCWTAQGIETLERSNDEKDFANLRSIIERIKPDKIVLGLPKNMNGTIGPQGEKVQNFGNRLKEFFSGEIVFWDERLTTVSAQRMLIDADLSRKKRKKNVDRVAAVLILQSYLDFLNKN